MINVRLTYNNVMEDGKLPTSENANIRFWNWRDFIDHFNRLKRWGVDTVIHKISYHQESSSSWETNYYPEKLIKATDHGPNIIEFSYETGVGFSSTRALINYLNIYLSRTNDNATSVH